MPATLVEVNGYNVFRFRKQIKLTQQDLADKVGISRSYVSEIENETKVPSKPVAEAIARYLGRNISDLQAEIDWPPLEEEWEPVESR